MTKNLKRCVVTILCIIAGITALFITMSVRAEGTIENISSPFTISDFIMNQNSAKAGDTIKYSFTLNDIGLKGFLEKYGEQYDMYPEYMGVHDITLYWSSAKKQKLEHTYKWDRRTDGNEVWNNETLEVSGELPVNKGMQKGEWYLSRIFFSIGPDDAGFYISDRRYPIYENGRIIEMDFSMADFTVEGTGKVDYKAPTLDLKSLKLSNRYAKGTKKSTFCVKVKDRSIIKKVECSWKLYGKDNDSKSATHNIDYEMIYNKKKKRYQVAIGLDTEFYRKAELYSISVEDIYGNKKNYSASYIGYAPGSKNWKYYNAYKKMMMIRQ